MSAVAGIPPVVGAAEPRTRAIGPAGARPGARDRPGGGAGRRPTARTPAPAPRRCPAAGRQPRRAGRRPGRPTPAGPTTFRGQPLGIARAGLHQLDVGADLVGQADGHVARPHPHPLAQLGQAGVGQGAAAGRPDLGRAPGGRDHGQRPRPAVGAGGPGPAGRLARLTLPQVPGQPVPAGSVGRGLARGHHAAERHPGPVRADPEEAGQADELGHRQLGRIHAQQGAGQHRPCRERAYYSLESLDEI